MVRMGRDGELWWKVVKGEALQETKESAACTHNHLEGIKGAQATALCIYEYNNNGVRRFHSKGVKFGKGFKCGAALFIQGMTAIEKNESYTNF